MKIPGLPEGIIVDRIGQPSEGEFFLNLNGTEKERVFCARYSDGKEIVVRPDTGFEFLSVDGVASRARRVVKIVYPPLRITFEVTSQEALECITRMASSVSGCAIVATEPAAEASA